jgi:hypothetical protein
MGNAYKILVVKPERKRLVGRLMHMGEQISKWVCKKQKALKVNGAQTMKLLLLYHTYFIRELFLSSS